MFYFGLREKGGQLREWGPTVRFRVMVDKTPPEAFDPQIAELGGKKYLFFATKDALSGVDHYELLKTEVEGAGGWQIAVSHFLLDAVALRGIIKIKAVDRAGNEKIMEVQSPYQPNVQDALWITLLLVGVGAIGWAMRANILKI